MRLILLLLFLASFIPVTEQTSIPSKVPSNKIPFCYGATNEVIELNDSISPHLYIGLGDYHFSVSTKNNMAAKFFDQGLSLYYGFNHPEALRSFKEAAKNDSTLAMAYWGQALCLGPNINMPMDLAENQKAYNLIQKALKLSEKATPKEKAYIAALSIRYSTQLNKRVELDNSYAMAMKELVKQFPNDADALALYAEALMDLHPWDFWQKDGQPQPWTPEITATLEKALSINSSHIGANHFYIHAVEASPMPAKAIASASRLGSLAPGAGHLVHMPSHIYIHVGEFHKGSAVNIKAINIDKESIKNGMLSVAYPEHNIHFLYTTLTLEGKSKEALMYAELLKNSIPANMLEDANYGGMMQNMYASPLYAMVRFGKWNEILKQKEPSGKYPLLRGIFHYAVGMAYVKTNRLDSVLKHHAALLGLLSEKKTEALVVWQTNTTKNLLEIAANLLEGEFYAAKKDYPKALIPLQNAIKGEDALFYDEPADWPNPTRNNYGAVLLEAGRAAEAEAIYREALKQYPENGWALIGLYNTLTLQQKTTEAVATKNRFDKAFVNADITLKSSRF
ncbi:tetratricopeptide repeat protein [Solitalea sp. MAHUQ-68]|uniref:Tetratricopeptide repeat protein n=1 Tax=Solitalea agri TaxID=2953739 RepID=A0A9X2EZC7_9SPHI|nr:tetratricopeptide repeat protein [Solitalea agri]MCO4291255.1 tetratricopeptide repeat protein [Solitalea agri]